MAAMALETELRASAAADQPFVLGAMSCVLGSRTRALGKYEMLGGRCLYISLLLLLLLATTAVHRRIVSTLLLAVPGTTCAALYGACRILYFVRTEPKSRMPRRRRRQVSLFWSPCSWRIVLPALLVRGACLLEKHVRALPLARRPSHLVLDLVPFAPCAPLCHVHHWVSDEVFFLRIMYSTPCTLRLPSRGVLRLQLSAGFDAC